MDGLPRILLLGTKQAGKTSIQHVVLRGTPPHETTFLSATARVEKQTSANDFVEFEVWDVPGQEPLDQTGELQEALNNCGAIVFVLDTKMSLKDRDPTKADDFTAALKRLTETILNAHRINPAVCVEVFMHKIDALNDAAQNDLLRRVRTHVADGVNARIEPRRSDVRVNYHMTSIFDSSVFQAFSYVVQQLIPPRSHVSSLLEVLNTQSKLQRSFLFDMQTRLCMAASSHVSEESALYELCNDFVEMVKSLSVAYGGNAVAADVSACDPDAFDNTFRCEVRLRDESTLILRCLERSLVFVGVSERSEPGMAPLTDYNVDVFKEAVVKMFRLDRLGEASP